jgi:hypothetical protein
MSVPYGAWMGSIEQDAFYPPHELCVEIQDFLAGNERLFSRQTANEVAVVYSIESEFQRVARRSQVANNQLNVVASDIMPFWQVCDALCAARQPYDVLFFPEGTLRLESLTSDDLAQYRTLILPDCHALTTAQAALLAAFLARGGNMVVLGDLGTNLPDEERQRLLEHPNVRHLASASPTAGDLLPGPQVRIESESDLMLNLQRVADGVALHVIRYGRDECDCTPTLRELTIELRLPGEFGHLSLHSPGDSLHGELAIAGEWHKLTLREVPLYGIALLTES